MRMYNLRENKYIQLANTIYIVLNFTFQSLKDVERLLCRCIIILKNGVKVILDSCP
jgi:hypothetical protein